MREEMNDTPQSPKGPDAFDVVEIVDRLTASHVSATVESANDSDFILRLSHEAVLPEEAHLRWFDGASAWQAIVQLRRLGETRVGCELAPSSEWEVAPARRSVRAPVENAPLVVRIVASKVLARGRRVHAVCVDISDTGCRANWPGGIPRVGDAIDVAWDAEISGAAPEWVPARVSRIIPRRFGAHHVCFSFDLADPRHAALVRAWHQSWLQYGRQRARDQRAA